MLDDRHAGGRPCFAGAEFVGGVCAELARAESLRREKKQGGMCPAVVSGTVFVYSECASL